MFHVKVLPNAFMNYTAAQILKFASNLAQDKLLSAIGCCKCDGDNPR